MSVLISLNDNPAGDGFLLAPLDSTYDAQLKLKTDPATPSATVTIQAIPTNPLMPGDPDPAAGLVFSTIGPITITPVETILTVHATIQSATRGDMTIQVLEAGTVVASFPVTSIRHPVVNFSGRFEARFATAPSLYNQNAMYTATNEDVSPGWTWGLEGEPDFVPVPGIIPENLETPGMGRVIRLNNPVALRSPADSVISTVKSISGQTATSSETFFIGDPLIGQPVNFGPDTYFAGNKEKSPLPTPQPEEYYSDAHEPMGLFEINLGNSSLYFRGASNVGAFTHKATFQGEHTRVPDSRPICTVGLVSASAEIIEKGLPSLSSFSETRILDLKNQYISLIAMGDVPSQQRRNLVRRIGHLLSAVSSATQTTVSAAVVAPDNFAMPPRGRSAPFAYANKEIFNGKIDTRLHALPGGSSVIDYFRQFFSFNFQWHPFTFHSDELCGHHKGTLSGDAAMTGNHIGDPHVHTVNGINYDFQSVGEFTLLRDGNYMEVQVRQTPVGTANPITDAYSGLTACVSLNTAVAARVGFYRIAYQPSFDREKQRARLQFFLDGKPAELLPEGTELNGNTVSAFDADGQIGLRIDYKDNTIVTVTPRFWDNHNVWYMNVSVSNTQASEGIMGHIPEKSWLPRLRNGQNVGPRPDSLNDRYITLYKTFADSWRVTDKTSLFVYAPGTSAETFTDPDWPAQQAPCNIKPQLQIPGAAMLQGMPVDKAEIACKLVTMDDLHKNCVFDVATTGDETFVKGYLFEQELRLAGTTVKLIINDIPDNPERSPNIPVDSTSHPRGKLVIATVVPITKGRPMPKGTVVFYADNNAVTEPVPLDPIGSARWKVSGLDKGNHTIKAVYSPDDKKISHSSSSINLNINLSESTIIHDHKDDDDNKDKGGIFSRWYFWVILILILLLLWCLFRKM